MTKPVLIEASALLPRRKWQKLSDKTPPASNAPLEHLFLSSNSKTGLSVNVAIARTCTPTKACMEYCYGLEGRMFMRNAINRQADNTDMFDRLETASSATLVREVKLLAEEVKCHQNFLRMFGVGDLQPGSVRFIKALAAIEPALSIWVSTRKFDLAAQFPVRPNLHLMLSLDSTTPAKNIEAARAIVDAQQGQAFLAWAQMSPGETVPPDVKVIFAEHHVYSGRAPWTEKNFDLRTCPATIENGADHDNACANCRFCFDTNLRKRFSKGAGAQWRLKSKSRTIATLFRR